MNETINRSSEAISAFIGSSGDRIPIDIVTQTVGNQFWVTTILTAISLATIFYFMTPLLRHGFSMILAKKDFLKLRKITGKPFIIINHTKRGLFGSSMIDYDTAKQMEKAIMKFKGKSFDIILNTGGGEIFWSQHIQRLIKCYPNEIRAIVPNFSMSGGTMIALSCDSIVMGQYACMGTVDPQLGTLFGGLGSAKQWKEIVRIKGKKANDQSIAMSMMGEQYTYTLKKNISVAVKDKLTKSQRNKFSEFMTSGDVEHGKPLSAKVLEGFGIETYVLSDELKGHINKILFRDSVEGVYYQE